MDGKSYYEFLQNVITKRQSLGNQFRFLGWLKKSDNSSSLQFSITKNERKSIPKIIIIKAKNDFNRGKIIDRKWFKKNKCNRGWCPPIVRSWILKNYTN